MSPFHPAVLAHRRKRFTRPDGARYLRPDAHRFGPPRLQEKSWAARMVDRTRAEEAEAAHAAEIAALEAEHRALGHDFAELEHDLAWRAFCRKYGFNPDQPRDELGRWTSSGGQSTGDDGQLIGDAGDEQSIGDAGDQQSIGHDNVRLAAMSWDARRQMIFGQRDLFEGEGGFGGGNRGSTPSLPPFRRDGPAAGVLQGEGKTETIISGVGGPASSMPKGAPGFDIVTSTHVEGHAAALMRSGGMSEATLSINHPAGVCSSCAANLSRMLPEGAKLDVIELSGTVKTFLGIKP